MRSSFRPARDGDHPEVRVKGQSFHSVLKALEEMRGTTFREAVLAHLPAEGGNQLREGSLLSANYYPVSWYRTLLGTAAQLAPEALGLARQVGRVSGERDIRGIYKVLFRALSTELVVKQSPRLFRIVYEGGNIEVLEVRSGFARVRYFDCFGFDRNVWQDAIGGAEAAFQATGTTKLSIRVDDGGADGDSTMATTVVWQ